MGLPSSIKLSFATSLALVGAQDAPSGARDSEASEADDALDESDLLAGDDIGIYRKSRRIYVKVSTQAPSQAEIVFSLSPCSLPRGN
jgi:hypothetical protein